jgi:hypothetical protein
VIFLLKDIIHVDLLIEMAKWHLRFKYVCFIFDCSFLFDLGLQYYFMPIEQVQHIMTHETNQSRKI